MRLDLNRAGSRKANSTTPDEANSKGAPNSAVELAILKDRLLEEHLRQAEEPWVKPWMKRAAEDAAALAWLTPYPLLVYPVLFEEKMETARKQATRQMEILTREQPAPMLAV